MQVTKIVGVLNRLYAIGDGRLWLRGFHGNWEAIETPTAHLGDEYTEVVDCAIGSTTEVSDDTGGGNETLIWIHVLTRDGRIFEQGRYGGWSEVK